MRLAFGVLLFSSLLCPLFLCAQDPGMAAAQQQQLLAMQQQQIQQTNQNNLDMQQAQRNAEATTSGPYIAQTPRLSVKAGSYPGAVRVKIEDRSRGAVIYYSTDGWTPTTQSQRYAGPLTIGTTTTLQAIAIVPGIGRSRIAKALYTIPAGVPIAGAKEHGQGTPVRVLFTAPFSSRGVEVGDAVPLALAEDLKLDGVTIPKGTSVAGTVTHVDGPGWSGLPASVSFAVHSVTKEGRVVALMGSETKDGPERSSARDILPFNRGHGVTIPMGAEFTAMVAETKDVASGDGSKYMVLRKVSGAAQWASPCGAEGCGGDSGTGPRSAH